MPDTLDDWLAHIERLHAQPIALGLDRVFQVCRALSIRQVTPVITVGGTNGKGSTCAMLERILLGAGYRVGLYTSPHLLHFNERVRINGVAADDTLLCKAFACVEAARNDVSLTYFEFGTLAAWEAFAATELDAVILEVGMGGRLDAVNVFDADCAIITSIDIDHAEFLGTTRDAIGFEKAGIFRTFKPAIVGEPKPPASLIKQAEKKGAALQIIELDFGYAAGEDQWSWWGQAESLGDKANNRNQRSGLPLPALLGSVQLANASAVLAALDVLDKVLPVSMQDIHRGLTEVDLCGRFQVLPGRPETILDVAHNPQAARALANNLGNKTASQETWAVFGMLRDKDISGVVESIKGSIDHWLVATLEGPRAASAGQLSAILANYGIVAEGELATPAQAWREARERAGENDRIIVFGSFLTVADVLRENAAE